MNPHMPIPTIVLGSNTDATPVTTKHQAVMYCCKYCSKHSKRKGQASVLYEVLDEMEHKDASARGKFGTDYEQSKLGNKLHRAFMAEVGEEMCQAEVAHHANRGPEYLCSRPEKYVHIYKKALAVSIQKQTQRAKTTNSATGQDVCEEPAEDADAPGVTTQRSDIDLYERRTQYWFWPESMPISPHLPAQNTPEEQVAAMSLWDFFRFVRFRGGRTPYLEWHPQDSLPIVIMSPTIRLTEGPDFAFGARWALMQFHPWHDRQYFLNKSDDEIKETFRAWRGEPDCPWYVVEQYLAENGRRARGGAGPMSKGAKQLAQIVALPQAEYEAQIAELLRKADYSGAAALKQQQELAIGRNSTECGDEGSNQEDEPTADEEILKTTIA